MQIPFMWTSVNISIRYPGRVAFHVWQLLNVFQLRNGNVKNSGVCVFVCVSHYKQNYFLHVNFPIQEAISVEQLKTIARQC